MCYPIPSVFSLQQAIPNGCSAKALPPSQRQVLGVQALAGNQTISELADDADVSRKFVYQQAAIAQTALEQAFAPAPADDQVLFYLPVTKAWLRQLVVALVMICHSSLRGVVELLRDLFAYPLSVGTVFNILDEAVTRAKPYNTQQALANVRIGAHDEMFQSNQPVLVGADVASTYCYLLSLERQRDADTWGVRLLELQERGFAPDATIADAGSGLRAGQELAMPQVPCRGDVFHGLMEMTELVTALENRAYQVMSQRDRVERQAADHQRRQGRANQGLGQKLRHLRPGEAQAMALAEDVALLARWLQHDVWAVNGLSHADRVSLYDFIVAELKAREHHCQRLAEARTFLKNQRDDLLAFAAQLDRDLEAVAQDFQVSVTVVRDLLNLQPLNERQPRRWQKEADLRQQLRGRFWALQQAVQDVARATVRASSVIENLNSRLRNYFFLRRHLGPDYLALLQFFLNHRRFLRSEHPERVGKSPAELLTGQAHPHWLEMLGYTRFSRN